MDSPTNGERKRHGLSLGSTTRKESTLASLLWIAIPLVVMALIFLYFFPS